MTARTPSYVVVPGLVPLVSKETGEITYIVSDAEWQRLDAMWPVKLVIA